MAWDLVNGAIMEVQIVGEFNANITRTIRHYRASVSGSAVNGEGALDAFAATTQFATMLADYRACCGDDWLMTYQQLQVISPARWRRYIYSVDTGPGTLGSSAQTASTAGFIELRGDIANRHSVGGVHMPCPGVEEYSAGKFLGAQLDRYGTLAAGLILQIATAAPAVTWTPVVFNRAIPANSVVVTDGQAQDTVRTMRRRVLGRGE